jgi:hypothetical protein
MVVEDEKRSIRRPSFRALMGDGSRGEDCGGLTTAPSPHILEAGLSLRRAVASHSLVRCR